MAAARDEPGHGPLGRVATCRSTDVREAGAFEPMNDRYRRLVGLLATVFGTALIVAVPFGTGLSTPGRYAIATMYFAGTLWVTGALPLPVTALLVPVLVTTFGIYPRLGEALIGFADPVIFLLLAGFMIAEAFQKHGIDRRIALFAMARLGSSPRRLVLGIMVSTAVLSMLISNTATTAMMVPIALGLVGQVADGDPGAAAPAQDGGGEPSTLHVAMLLGTAYAASLGGVGTLIGTPPNAIVVGQLRELLDVEITFVDWLAIGLPMVVVTLPVAWYLLTFHLYPPKREAAPEADDRAREQLSALGPLDPGGRRVVAIFVVTAGLWLFGGVGFLFVDVLPPGWHVTLFGGTGASVFGPGGHQGVLYYVIVGLLAIPALVLSGSASWDDLATIDWGTLILLGGGISLANALADTDATRWIADVTIGALGPVPVIVVLLVLIGLTVTVGELASNTAMAAILVPILVAVGPTYAGVLGTSSEMAAVFLALAGAIAASYGFALPVATPPNAIVFGTGRITRSHMLKAGVVLDVVVVLLATGLIAILLRIVWPAVIG